jgi:hypothetical protein
VSSEEGKATDDVAGVASASLAGPLADPDDGTHSLEPDPDDSDRVAPAPAPIAELAAACVRFVATRYGIHLDFTPETLSLVDQWVSDARGEMKERPELVDLVQGAAGAYVGEVVRRAFGATWRTEGDHADWRLLMSTVYCAFNPVGIAREALLLGEAEGWHAHFELDPGERQGIEDRLAALPEVRESDYYAPSTRFDVMHIVFDALRDGMRARGLGDTRFTAEDYGGV